MTMKIYEGLDRIPKGRASDHITPGCIVLEGGAWRGLYTQGALDALMEADLNFQTVIGVSAGAMSGFSYVSGQIGRSARINLHYRHDPEYCGLGAMIHEHGITGFSHCFTTLSEEEPLDEKAFNNPDRRFVVTATDLETGRNVFFERGKTSDIMKAIQASATAPYVSEPVVIDGRKYLDGGVACKIPVDWALDQGYEKIVVLKTRDRSYRKPVKKPARIIRTEYHNYPEFMRDLLEEAPAYNLLLDRIEHLGQQGRLFIMAPVKPIEISRFEGDMNKLGDLYWQGYNETKKIIPSLKEYLKK